MFLGSVFVVLLHVATSSGLGLWVVIIPYSVASIWSEEIPHVRGHAVAILIHLATPMIPSPSEEPAH